VWPCICTAVTVTYQKGCKLLRMKPIGYTCKFVLRGVIRIYQKGVTIKLVFKRFYALY
jgi:hypothetical protein